VGGGSVEASVLAGVPVAGGGRAGVSVGGGSVEASVLAGVPVAGGGLAGGCAAAGDLLTGCGSWP